MADKAWSLTRKDFVLVVPPLLLCIPTLDGDTKVVLGCIGLSCLILVYGCLIHQGKLFWRMSFAFVITVFMTFVVRHAYLDSLRAVHRPHMSMVSSVIKPEDEKSATNDIRLDWTNSGTDELINLRGILIFDQEIAKVPYRERPLAPTSTTAWPGDKIYIKGYAFSQRPDGGDIAPTFVTLYLKYDDAISGDTFVQKWFFRWEGYKNGMSMPELHFIQADDEERLSKKYSGEFLKIK